MFLTIVILLNKIPSFLNEKSKIDIFSREKVKQKEKNKKWKISRYSCGIFSFKSRAQLQTINSTSGLNMSLCVKILDHCQKMSFRCTHNYEICLQRLELFP